MPKSDEPTRAIGYIRVGVKDKGLSAAAQRSKLEGYAEDQELELCDTYQDLDTDAEAPFKKRPGLSKAVHALSRHDATVLLAVDQDRFATQPLPGLFLEHMCEERASARLRTVDNRPIDWGEGAKVARLILSEFVEAEQSVDDAVGFGDNPGDWAVVEAAQNLAVEKRNTDPKTQMPVKVKLTLREIAEELEKRGYKDRRGNKFSTNAVSRMLEMRTSEMESRKTAGDRASGLVAVAAG